MNMITIVIAFLFLSIQLSLFYSLETNKKNIAVSFGDSLTHGFIVMDNVYSLHPYTIQLNKNIVKNNQTSKLYAYESGADGETTIGMIQRIQYVLDIYQPNIIIIWLQQLQVCLT